MARQSISEQRAKSIIYQALNLEYDGISIGKDDNFAYYGKRLASYDRYVVKVDQGIKGRYKKGLIYLDVAKQDIPRAIHDLSDKGYAKFLIEPMFGHKAEQEQYLNFELTRTGLMVKHAAVGGIDVGSKTIFTAYDMTNDDTNVPKLAKATGLDTDVIQTLKDLFFNSYFSFMEINPFIVRNGKPNLLDTAVQVDSAASYFTGVWSSADFTDPQVVLTEEEANIKLLSSTSPASFTLQVLNPDGKLFVLLSGGGASVLVADEITNRGYGKELGNYGEYSGNPTSEETELYTDQLLSLLLKSSATNKVLLIAGAVANFTDIVRTFEGIIRSIDKHAQALKEQAVTVHVRRGGPRQKQGLQQLWQALAKHGISAQVSGPERSISTAVRVATEAMT